MKYIIIGKIVNTHGIKGELRILSDFKYKDKIFKKGFPLYIGHTKEKEIINTYRPHKQFDMVTFNNYNNINEVLKYKGEYVFINKEDLELNSNQYLNEDLIGLEVITQNKSLGTLKKIEKYSSKYETLVVENNGKRILIPYNFDIILDRFIKLFNIEFAESHQNWQNTIDNFCGLNSIPIMKSRFCAVI